jgi:hypothetical protein
MKTAPECPPGAVLPGARRWINGYERSGKHYEPILRIIPRDIPWVTWGEFVEARILAEFRDRDKVPNTRLRAAVDAGSVHPTQSPRQIAASRYVGLHGSGSDIADRGCDDEKRK